MLVGQGWEPILFGVGREGAFELTKEAAGVSFAGHTLWGQIVEFGLVLTFIYYFTAYLLIKQLYGGDKAFILIPVLSIAVLGLSPLSYLGLLTFLYHVAEVGFSSNPQFGKYR
jgi:hypothetical protein